MIEKEYDWKDVVVTMFVKEISVVKSFDEVNKYTPEEIKILEEKLGQRKTINIPDIEIDGTIFKNPRFISSELEYRGSINLLNSELYKMFKDRHPETGEPLDLT